MRRPFIVSVTGCYFLLAGAYLCVIALVMLLLPDTISAIRKAPYAYGFTLGSPYIPLLVGIGWSLTAWGLLRLRNWARWVTMLMLAEGVAWAAVTLYLARPPLSWRVVFNWTEIALRALTAVYLAQAPSVLDAFKKRP